MTGKRARSGTKSKEEDKTKTKDKKPDNTHEPVWTFMRKMDIVNIGVRHQWKCRTCNKISFTEVDVEPSTDKHPNRPGRN
jgi:hypothetical protein